MAMDPSSSRRPPASQPAAAAQTQPKLTRLSLQGFFELPRRLCAPPKAVGKVRSFGLTPIFDVTLDDVLARKHLPPLSLKDFEEWLLFVEQCPENLYFVLWLREYTNRYDIWAAKLRAREAKTRARARARGTAQNAYRVPRAVQASPALALFFARARETFFAPGSAYELILPPHLLAPFFRHGQGGGGVGGASPHPDPTMFDPLRLHIEACLRVSLQRFVKAAYTNVGSYRALCGICAGCFITLAGSLPPIVVNFVTHASRWERFAALPGLWFGLTILIASLRGVCMMIYIFGDFRQLRRFELERPPLPSSPTETVLSEKAQLEQGYMHTLPSLPSVSIAVPARPVRALTAPPKISIYIPTRPSSMSTPALSLGTTTSATGLTTEVSMFTDSRIDDTTLHTISISSVKSRGASASVAHWPHEEHEHDAEIISELSDEDDVDFDEEDEEDDSSLEEHGIYVSAAMPAPEEVAEEDPAVLSAALALIAADANAHVHPGAAAVYAATCAGAGAGPSSPTSAVPSSATQTQTAAFIPAYSYASCGGTADARERRQSRVSAHERERDLERGPASDDTCAPTAPTALPLAPFDFDALPPPPRVRSPAAPGSPVSPQDETLACASPVDEKALLSSALSTPATAVFPGPTFPAAPPPPPSRKPRGLLARLSTALLFSAQHTSCPSAFSSSSVPASDTSPRTLFTWASPGGARSWRSRIRREQRTPTFGPVTRVLEPVVARAQWEIVVRAAALAAILAGGIVGALVAVPVPGS